MSFRLNPFKILRFVGIVALLSYAYVEFSEFRNNQKKSTESASKNIKVRDKNFVNSDKVKNDLTSNQSNNTQTTTTGTNVAAVAGAAAIAGNQNTDSTNSTTTSSETKTEDKTQETTKNTETDSAKTTEEQKRKEIEVQKQAAKQKALEEQKLQVQKAAEEQKRKAQEEAIKKAQREAQLKKQQQAQNTQTTKTTSTGGKKYIQVATLTSEAAAKSAVKRLGGNFGYRKSGNKYIVISKTVSSEQELNTLKSQINSRIPGTKYAVRSAGK